MNLSGRKDLNLKSPGAYAQHPTYPQVGSDPPVPRHKPSSGLFRPIIVALAVCESVYVLVASEIIDNRLDQHGYP